MLGILRVAVFGLPPEARDGLNLTENVVKLPAATLEVEKADKAKSDAFVPVIAIRGVPVKFKVA